MKLDHFDLLSKESLQIQNVGSFKSPLLKEIQTIGIDTYNTYLSCITLTPSQFYDFIGNKNEYKSFPEEKRSKLNIYDLLISNDILRNLLEKAFCFFMDNQVVYNDYYKVFLVYEKNKTDNKPIGIIGKENFLEVKDLILQMNYIKLEEQEEKPAKYKNAFAKRLVERMEKANKEKSNKEDIPLGKKISKYCADNKNGINMLNVFDLTIYQFYDQWIEHNNIRQCNIQDNIYTNTVSFKDLKLYDPQLWLK